MKATHSQPSLPIKNNSIPHNKIISIGTSLQDIKLRNYKLIKRYPLLNTNISSTHIKKMNLSNNKHIKFKPAPLKNNKILSISKQISQMENNINFFSYKNRAHLDYLEKTRDDTKTLTHDLHKYITKNTNFNQKATKSFEDIIDSYINKGYKIPNFHSQTNNIFKMNPLLDNDKNIQTYYYSHLRTSPQNKRPIYKNLSCNEIIPFKDKKYKYLTKISKEIQNTKNNKNKDNNNDEQLLLQRLLNRRATRRKGTTYIQLSFDEDNMELTKEIEMISNLLDSEEFQDNKTNAYRTTFTSHNNNSTIPYEMSESTCYSFTRKGVDKKNKFKQRKTMIAPFIYRPNQTVKFTTLNRSSKKGTLRSTNSIALSLAPFRSRENNSIHKLSRIYGMKEKMGDFAYMEMVGDYYENKGIKKKAPKNTEDFKEYCQNAFKNIKYKLDVYNTKEVWKTNYSRLGIFNKRRSKFDAIEKLDNDLGKLDQKYVKTFGNNNQLKSL